MKKGRARPGRCLLTLALTAAMLLGLICTPLGRTHATAAGATGPVVEANDDGTYDVTFSYQGNGTEVLLTGNMYGWGGNTDAGAKPMEQDESGVWRVTVALEPGTYEYKFIVNGANLQDPWIVDPKNPVRGDNGNSYIGVGYESPVVNGTSVTFTYINKNSGITNIQIAGEMNGWVGQNMNNEGNGVFTYTYENLIPNHTYQYKFISNVGENKWVPDPANSLPLDIGNSQFTTGEPKPEPEPEPPKGESVIFTYEGAANSVEVHGTMFDVAWSGEEMTNDGNDVWTATVNIEKPGTYQYKFVVNGAGFSDPWISDPNNPFRLNDGNSLIAVGYESPVVDGTSVTLTYINTDTAPKKVLAHVELEEGKWEDFELTPDGNVYTCKISDLSAGTHQYKLRLRYTDNENEDTWVADPANKEELVGGDGNSQFTIEEKIEPKPVISPEINGREVTFRYVDPDAEMVIISGTIFTPEWAEKNMTRGDNGVWEYTVTLEPGEYKYKFKIGNDWKHDTLNPNTTGDGYGGLNSVLTVPGQGEVDPPKPVVSPEIDGHDVTFRYENAKSSVELMGTLPGADWIIDGKPALTKNSETGVWEITVKNIPAGKYEYKFHADGEWKIDPRNSRKVGDNNWFAIAGLAAPGVRTVKAGGELELPETLALFGEDGNSSDVTVTYALNGEYGEGVTIEGTTLTVPEGFEGGSINVTAKAGEDTVEFTVNVVKTLYTYNIYFFDWDSSHLSTTAADMHVWEYGGADIGDLPFDGTVTISGKTWLKGTITTPAKKIGVIPRSIGDWVWQTKDMIIDNSAGEESVDVYIVMGEETPHIGTPPELPDEQGRSFYVPGTFPGPSWDAASNRMELIDEENQIYAYTFNSVPAANYEFKIAVNGAWDPENYGVGGVLKGDNYSVTVPEDMNVTVYYSDVSHLAVTSINYQFVKPVVRGESIDDLELTDPGLTGIYSGKVSLTDGTYTGLALTVDGKEIGKFSDFALEREQDVTFYYAPAYNVWYTSAAKWDDNAAVTYDSKDLAFKDPFGAVPTDTPVTFSVETSGPITGVTLVVGTNQYPLTKGEADGNGTTKWTGDVRFPSIGEYKYYFIIAQEGGVRVYCDDDGYYGTGMLTELTNLKPYDLVVYRNDYKTPDWMKDAVIYQIFPDRFFNGDESNDDAQTTARGSVNYEFPAWDKIPENPEQEKPAQKDAYEATGAFWGDGEWSNEIYGGDLKGIADKVKYLRDLGVTVIYLNPVFASISNHRYDTTDYTKIDPILGDLEDFRTLVKAAYENGMHIILDGVFNHVSDDSIYFDRYYKFLETKEYDTVGAYPYWAWVYDYMTEKGVGQSEAEEAAKEYFTETYGVTDFSYTTWFDISNEPMEGAVDTIGLRKGLPVYSYGGWWGYDSMPIIKSTNGSEFQTEAWARDVITDDDSVTRYWLQQGSNGWRLDVANEVSDETWQKFRDVVKEESGGDAVIVGEIWDDATKYLMGDMYDSVMNYMFRNAVTAFAMGGDSEQAMKDLEKIRERYPEEAFYAMMNLVDSHDTTRIVSYLDGIPDDRTDATLETAFPTYETTSDAAKEMQKLVAFLQFTYAGAPTIYYGDERGMVGADDPDDRRTIADWDEVTDEALLTWYQKLGQLRHDWSALRTGSVEPVDTKNSNVLGYVRRNRTQTLIVLANNAAGSKEVTLTLADLDVTAEALTELISGDEITVTGGTVTVTVPARRGLVIAAGEADPENVTPLTPPDYDAMDHPQQPTPPTPPMPPTPPTPPVITEPTDPTDPTDPEGPTDPDEELPDEDTPKEDLPDEDTPKEDLPDEEPPKEELPDEDTPKEDLPDEEPPKEDLPDEEPPKTDIPDEEPPKDEQPGEEPPTDDRPADEVPGDETPKTGDTSHLTVWVALMALSAMGLAVTLVLRKKSRRN